MLGGIMKNGYFNRKELKKALCDRREYLIKIDGKDSYTFEAIATALSKDDSGYFGNTIYRGNTVRAWFDDTVSNLPDNVTLEKLCKYLQVDLTSLLHIETNHNRPLYKNEKIEICCELTGLSHAAVVKLMENKASGRNTFAEGLSLLLTDKTNIIYHLLNCISAYRLNEDITVDILPKDIDKVSLFIDHYNKYMDSLESSIEYEACRISQYDNKGILATSKKGSKITINEDFELDSDLIRQAKLNRLTTALWNLADKVSRAGSIKKLLNR